MNEVLHKLFLGLIVVIALLSLVSVVMLFGSSVTGLASKELDNSVTGISFIIVGLIIFASIILIVGLVRAKR